MSTDRPQTTNIECTVCGATVAAWPEVMVCHCQEVAWKRIAAPITDDRLTSEEVRRDE